MDELDLLKSHWQKDDRFPQIKADEIQRMLHRSSSSIVKWIFIISVLELFAGFVLSLVVTTEDKDHSLLLQMFYAVADVVFYVVIAYFIYQFFTSFRKIRTTNNAKSLIETIFQSRRHVNNYITFNLYYLFIGFVVIAGNVGYEKAAEMNGRTLFFFLAAFVIIMTLVGLLFYFLVRLYYRVLYGILLGRLNKNYEELVKLEQDEA